MVLKTKEKEVKMKVYLVFTDDCNEEDCGCYIESVDSVYLSKEEAEKKAKEVYRGEVREYNVEDS